MTPALLKQGVALLYLYFFKIVCSAIINAECLPLPQPSRMTPALLKQGVDLLCLYQSHALRRVGLAMLYMSSGSDYSEVAAATRYEHGIHRQLHCLLRVVLAHFRPASHTDRSNGTTNG
jgi:formate hydrogenlyase subunit 4